MFSIGVKRLETVNQMLQVMPHLVRTMQHPDAYTN